LYPFTIGDSPNISGTHQQAYALDLENDNVTVWYTLAGANNSEGAKLRSSLYAADPYDAMENYFIYTTSYGSGAITYCGAGHSSVTGPTTKNNDERKLFINVIVNSAEAVKAKPSIKIYDPDTDFKNEMQKDEEILAETGKTVYVAEVDDKTSSPEFDIKITMPEDDILINQIKVYYDLDLEEADLDVTRPGFNDEGDTPDRLVWQMKYIYDEKTNEYYWADENNNKIESDAMASKGVLENTSLSKKIQMKESTAIKEKNAANSKLKLSDELFAPYGGNYTYIVVEVYYENKNTPVYTIIKVKASDPLFELTQGDTYNVVNNDYVVEKKYVLA
jgi:hypothetical protein